MEGIKMEKTNKQTNSGVVCRDVHTGSLLSHLPSLAVSGLQSRRACLEVSPAAWLHRRHLRSYCWRWPAQPSPSSDNSDETRACFSCYRNTSDTCTHRTMDKCRHFVSQSFKFEIMKKRHRKSFKTNVKMWFCTDAWWIYSGCLTLTWVVGSTDPGCSACRIAYSRSSSCCGKRDHFRSPLSQSWSARTTIVTFSCSRKYTIAVRPAGYHDNILGRLRSIEYGRELREAVLWFVSSGSQYFWRHLYGNAAQLVLDVVLKKYVQTFNGWILSWIYRADWLKC